MHTKISSGKEHRRHRARRVSVLLVVLALLFTMLPTGLYTVAGAALMAVAVLLPGRKKVK